MTDPEAVRAVLRMLIEGEGGNGLWSARIRADLNLPADTSLSEEGGTHDASQAG